MSGIKKKCIEIFLTIFYIGKIPFAPGTFGSFFGLLVAYFFYFFQIHFFFFFFFSLVFTVIAIPLVDVYEKDLQIHDHKSIVIDEFIGIFISFFMIGWLEINIFNLILTFVLFRFFDIKKPWIIKQVDMNVLGGLGVIFDDILAGIGAGILGIILIFSFSLLG
ncbi:phosphatidylglycerophosphatase A [Candidatus Gracilibacteria bacterium]|nr:phosphatidylglycerophosphatase A [Candidatus Gracilibacteria bacterium]NUJ99415.1 phosphatidylglycerophosphatase A [Candidatus Gracilibacteria bacterium]